jgi:formate dehydrogenase subunit beta
MTTHWLLLNRGDVPGIVGKFLRDLWRYVGLRGMVIPRQVPGQFSVAPRFVEDWLLLDRVDPFAPVLAASAAPLVVDLARTQPHARLGAVLRPCELRALAELRRQAALPADGFVIVGIDCLGTYPSEVYSRRAEREGAASLTVEVVERGRNGDLGTEAFRPACQMCLDPTAEGADVTIGITGPRGRELVLISTRDAHTAWRLHLAEITDGTAPSNVVVHYQAWLASRARRHERARAEQVAAVSPSLPQSVAALRDYLAQCAPCQACLRACPRYAGEFSALGNGAALEHQAAWVQGCAQCGLCEAACPRGLPLTALLARLGQRPPVAATGAVQSAAAGLA